MTPLVEYLKNIASKKGLDTTRKFAEAAGIGKTTADNLLKGRAPRPETLEKVADNLGLPLNRLRELDDLAPTGGPLVLGPESALLTPRQRRLVSLQVQEFAKLNAALATKSSRS